MNWSDLPSQEPRTLHVAELEPNRSDYNPAADRATTTDIAVANVISSIATDGTGLHYPVLDLDIPAHLVPSSTPGNTHLYIDLPLTPESLWAICDALAEAGVLQPGYVAACKARGYTSVRLPWVKKAEVTE